MKDFNIKPAPSYPKPGYEAVASLEAQSCELLILILTELQKINKHLDNLTQGYETLSVREIVKYD